MDVAARRVSALIEIDRGTCPAMAGPPSGRKSLRRRYIQRRDALLQVPIYCWDQHHSPSKGTLESALLPGLRRSNSRSPRNSAQVIPGLTPERHRWDAAVPQVFLPTGTSENRCVGDWVQLSRMESPRNAGFPVFGVVVWAAPTGQNETAQGETLGTRTKRFLPCRGKTQVAIPPSHPIVSCPRPEDRESKVRG